MTKTSPILFALIAIILFASNCAADTYYVATNGYDSRSRQTASHRNYPWRTIQHAVNQARGGDEIVVLNGTYYEEVFFTRSGWAGSEILLRSENREGAKVIGSIGGDDVSYIIVDGFDVTNRRLDAGQSKGITFNRCHHLTVRDNRVHNCRGGGISIDQSDWILIEWNIVHHNAFYDPGQHSGISVYQCQRRGGDSGVIGVIIRNNTTFANENRVNNARIGRPTDGNGIVVDDSLNLDPSGNGQSYGRIVLVENNLSFLNGGQGVHCYQSTDVIIRNNTLFKNMSSFMFGGEVSVVASNDVLVFNNILFANDGRYANLQFQSSNVWWDYNLIHNGPSMGVFNHNHTIYAHPQFAFGTLRPRSGSRAIDAGLTQQGRFPLDVDGQFRFNGSVDIGANEFHGF